MDSVCVCEGWGCVRGGQCVCVRGMKLTMVKVELVKLHPSDKLSACFRFKARHVFSTQLPAHTTSSNNIYM